MFYRGPYIKSVTTTNSAPNSACYGLSSVNQSAMLQVSIRMTYFRLAIKMTYVRLALKVECFRLRSNDVLSCYWLAVNFLTCVLLFLYVCVFALFVIPVKKRRLNTVSMFSYFKHSAKNTSNQLCRPFPELNDDSFEMAVRHGDFQEKVDKDWPFPELNADSP